MMIKPRTEDITLPMAKNTDKAVKRYCFRLGRFSRNRVPSVGIDPPTPVPRRKRDRQSIGKELEKADSRPKILVTRRV